jgi:hypothetical protein
MTNEQLWMAIGAPLLFNGLIFILILTNINARFASLEAATNARFASVENRLVSLEQHIDLLTGAIHELDNRLTRVGERLERH